MARNPKISCRQSVLKIYDTFQIYTEINGCKKNN